MKVYLGFILLFSIVSALSIKDYIKQVENPKVKNDRPVIGILTQPIWPDQNGHDNTTYVEAAYVKYIESLGGLVIPIHFTYDYLRIEELMGQVNGILFPGGDLNLTDPKTGEYSRFAKVADFIYQKAIEINKRGTHFPLWGTCQGHQLMMMLESGDHHIIRSDDRMWLSDFLNLNFLDQKSTKMFYDFSDELILALETEPITYNIHYFGIHLSDFNSNKNLSSHYRVLSTNIDDSGVEYVSATEHVEFPFYTVQFHPERNLFLYDMPNTPHSQHARELATKLADRLVSEAKMSMNNFEDYNEMVGLLVETTGTDEMDLEEYDEYYYFKVDYP